MFGYLRKCLVLSNFSLGYDLYGRVIEQLVNWINVFIHFLAMLLILNRSIGKSYLQKFFVITLLIVVSLTADPTAFLFSMYAEVLAAFLLLLFVVILTDPFEQNPKNYALRLFLLLLIASSFYFVKTKFLFLTYGLIFLAIIFDIKYLFKNLKKILTSPYFYGAVLCIMAIWLFGNAYVNQTLVLKVGYLMLKYS